ncbi:RNA polymerase sigma factor [Actinomadura scrupuli]|uniref:RNA polymerase sigma factor n=1 Tax=Actinomadura scrupuli TaxID=559629 RepID=UPI003D99EF60
MDAPEPASMCDEELHRRLALGDETALEQVYDLFSPLVYGLAARVTANAEGARDVAQEVFITLWERPHLFDPERGSLRTFLAVIAHRRAVDWVRRESRANLPAPADRDHHPEEVEDSVVANELADIVRRRLVALPPPLRAVLEMAYFQGHTYREVAARLSIPEGTAKSRIRSALARLGRELEREGFP